MLNRDKIDALFQYILAIAAQAEDFAQRELGAIHLIKYAYLADLAYAGRHSGDSFTGADWRFFHFGPWSAEVFERIPSALQPVPVFEKRITSRYADDYSRYGMHVSDAKSLAQNLEDQLPFVVANAVSQAVHQHGADTADLLRHVYLTAPMLAAAPGEALDIRGALENRKSEGDAQPAGSTKVSAKLKKPRASAIEAARAEISRRLAAPIKQAQADPPPRYDDVFYEGTAALDRLAGEPPTEIEAAVEFDDSIWRSEQRRDPDIP